MPTLMTPAILLLHSYYFLLGFDIAVKCHVWNSNTVHETCRYATINHSHQSPPPPPPPPHISYILLLINGHSLFVGFFNILTKLENSAKNAPAAVVVVVVVVVGVICGGGDCCESCCCCNGTATVAVVYQ